MYFRLSGDLSFMVVMEMCVFQDELIVRIEKKLEILREEKTLLELEIKENEALGKEVNPADIGIKVKPVSVVKSE